MPSSPGEISAYFAAGGIRRFRSRSDEPPAGDHIIGGAAWAPASPPTPTAVPRLRLPILISTFTGTSAPAPTFTFAADAPAGCLLSVVVGDGFGHVPTLTAVSDSKGNAYEVDSAENQPAGDGSCYVAHSHLTSAIEAGDTITVRFDRGAATSFEIIATPFIGAAALDVAGAAVGFFGTGPATASVAGGFGDLLIAYAVSDGGTIAPDPAWTTFIRDQSDGVNDITAVWKQASAASAAFEVLGGRYGAAVAVAYR